MTSEATLALLIDQWSDKPNLRAIIQIWLDINKNHILDAIDDLKEMADVDTAEGVWLDYIGIRLGVNRPSVDSATTLTEEAILAFGFSSLDGSMKSGVGFGQAPFDFSKASTSQSFLDDRTQLGDQSYRKLVKSRGWYVRSTGTLFFLRRSVQEIDPMGSVLDNRDMTVSIMTSLAELMRIAIEVECLPLPAAVKPLIVDTARPSIPAGVTVSRSAISLFEGRTTTYTLVLDSPPADGETVTITPVSSDTAHVTVSGGPVDFDADDWNIAQIITVEAASDVDSDDETETITNTVSTDGARYTGVTADDITVSVDDSTVSAADPVISIAAYLDVTTIVEGTAAEWVITADIAPMSDITIGLTVSRSGAFVRNRDTGTDKEVILPMGETSVRYTVATVDDENEEADGSVTVALNAGTGYAVDSSNDSVEIAVTDDDETDPFVISIAAVSGSTAEGTSIIFRISADRAVTEDLAIPYTVAQDGDYIATSQVGSKSATISNTFQTVDITIPTVDDDEIEDDGSVTITLDAPADGADYSLSSNSSASIAVTSEDVLTSNVLAVPNNFRLSAATSRHGATLIYIRTIWDRVENAGSYQLRFGQSDTNDEDAVTELSTNLRITTTQRGNATLTSVDQTQRTRWIWVGIRARPSNTQLYADSPWSGWVLSHEHIGTNPG